MKGPRGPFKGTRGPFKGPRGPFKGPRGPFTGPRGPFKGPLVVKPPCTRLKPTPTPGGLRDTNGQPGLRQKPEPYSDCTDLRKPYGPVSKRPGRARGPGRPEIVDFRGFRLEIAPGTPLDRPAVPRTSICTKNQPRIPILRPLLKKIKKNHKKSKKTI